MTSLAIFGFFMAIMARGNLENAKLPSIFEIATNATFGTIGIGIMCVAWLMDLIAYIDNHKRNKEPRDG